MSIFVSTFLVGGGGTKNYLELRNYEKCKVFLLIHFTNGSMHMNIQLCCPDGNFGQLFY